MTASHCVRVLFLDSVIPALYREFPEEQGSHAGEEGGRWRQKRTAVSVSLLFLPPPVWCEISAPLSTSPPGVYLESRSAGCHSLFLLGLFAACTPLCFSLSRRLGSVRPSAPLRDELCPFLFGDTRHPSNDSPENVVHCSHDEGILVRWHKRQLRIWILNIALRISLVKAIYVHSPWGTDRLLSFSSLKSQVIIFRAVGVRTTGPLSGPTLPFENRTLQCQPESKSSHILILDGSGHFILHSQNHLWFPCFLLSAGWSFLLPSTRVGDQTKRSCSVWTDGRHDWLRFRLNCFTARFSTFNGQNLYFIIFIIDKHVTTLL